jgi:hypothetical protein
MKVLLYTVFKDREGRSLKAEQCSTYRRPSTARCARAQGDTANPHCGSRAKDGVVTPELVEGTISAGISDHTLEMSDRFLDARLVCGRLSLYTPLQPWKPRSNDMYSLERR